MAKKTAAPKKTAAKQKVAKPAKAAKPSKPAPAAKTAKAKAAPMAKAKPVAKPAAPKADKKVDKALVKSAAKPALMTKKGKAQPVEVEEPVVKKIQTVTSMIEQGDAPAEDAAKVDKLSKVKPIRVERGNLADEKAKWIELNKKYGKEKALAYKMSDSFASLSPLQHKVLGWGFILTNDNDRLEVLFENGIRVLISNYKS